MNRTQLLLIQLMEECAELQKECSKALRFGLDDRCPDTSTPNRCRLTHEANDVRALMEMLSWEGVDMVYYPHLVATKYEKVEQFMKYSSECGILSFT